VTCEDDEWPEDSVFVNCWFDDTVVGHDSKGERIPTPYGMTITCPGEFEGYAKAVFAWLLNRYGWRGEITVDPIFGDGHD
jgi:hypothetical protein